MEIVISVPGKIIISGEHSVVYGKPAVVAAVDKRLTMYLQTRTDNKQIINSTYDHISLVNKAIEFFVDRRKILYSDGNKNRSVDSRIKKNNKIKKGWAGRRNTMKGFELNIESDIPVGAGMGSSAAIAVGVAAVFTAVSTSEARLNLQKINEIAYEIEKVQHGNPSGIDNSVVTFGGFLWYRKEFEFLKTFWKLKFKLADKLDNFYLINTGKPEETTGEMVALASSKPQRKNQNLLNGFEQVTKQIMLALREEDEKNLMEGIKENQRLLEKIRVVGEFAKNIVRKIENSGGAAKISGAGGVKDKSGMLLVYHKNKSATAEVANKYGLEQFPAKLGAEGVKIEKMKV